METAYNNVSHHTFSESGLGDSFRHIYFHNHTKFGLPSNTVLTKCAFHQQYFSAWLDEYYPTGGLILLCTPGVHSLALDYAFGNPMPRFSFKKFLYQGVYHQRWIVQDISRTW